MAFLDVDDFWHPKKLERRVHALNEQQVALAYGNFWIKYEKGSEISLATSDDHKGQSLGDDLLKDYRVGLLTLVLRSLCQQPEASCSTPHIISSETSMLSRDSPLTGK